MPFFKVPASFKTVAGNPGTMPATMPMARPVLGAALRSQGYKVSVSSCRPDAN